MLISGSATYVAGVDRQSAFSKTRRELGHVNMNDSVWAVHKAQLERHEVFGDFQSTRMDEPGQIRCWGISGMPIFDVHGCYTGYRCIGLYITKMITNQGLTSNPERLNPSQNLARLALLDALFNELLKPN